MSVLERSGSDHEASENPSRPSQPPKSPHRFAHECFFASPNRRHIMTAAIHHEELINLLQPQNNRFAVIGFTARIVTKGKDRLGNF